MEIKLVSLSSDTDLKWLDRLSPPCGLDAACTAWTLGDLGASGNNPAEDVVETPAGEGVR